MKAENFTKIIQKMTGRNFVVRTEDAELISDKKYYIYRELPLSKRKIGFDFKTPKNEENILKSFISTFTNKYREPDPEKYKKNSFRSTGWEDMTEEQKEFAYCHHSSNMYSKDKLLDIIRENLKSEEAINTLSLYGFYETLYGIGVFVLFGAEYKAIKGLKTYLENEQIPFTNEFSDKGWVYRFKINLDKDIHKSIIINYSKLNKTIL